MSTDDESKKDEHNKAGPAQERASEQTAPALFPENSVFDLEPIVVPENMRLAAPEDESETKVGNEQPLAVETARAPSVENTDSQAPVSPEAQPLEVTAEPVAKAIKLPPQPPIGSTQSKLKITPRKVKATTTELSKISQIETGDSAKQSGRVDGSETTITGADPSAETTSESKPEAWTEHASAVLEHFGWEEAQFSKQEQSSNSSPPASEAVSRSAQSDLSAEQESSPPPEKFDDEVANRIGFFPENSAFDLEPIHVPEDQRLVRPVAQQPKPDPRPTIGNQKLSPIKIGQLRPAPQKSESTGAPASIAATTATEPSAAQLAVNAEVNSSLVQSEIILPSSNGDQHVVIAEPVNEGQDTQTAAVADEDRGKTEEGDTSWREEQTGWEEIVSKGDGWQEQTGQDEAVAEKSEWERSGWSQADGETDAQQTDQHEPNAPGTAGGVNPPGASAEETGDNDPVTAQEHPPQQSRSVDALFVDAEEDEDGNRSGEDSAAAVGTKTLEIEPTEREDIENRIGTATGEHQYSPGDDENFASEQEDRSETASQNQEGESYPIIEIPHVAPPAVSDQSKGFEEDQKQYQSEDGEPGGMVFDINNMGIGTADIDQIILEHQDVQLTLRSGALLEEEEEERYLKELLLKEQRDAEQQERKLRGQDPQLNSQEFTNPDFAHDPVEEYEVSYDEEEAIQEYRPTDSIYELAPFVLPTAGDRLTDSPNAVPGQASSIKQAVNATDGPERAAVPSYSSDPLVGSVLAHSYEILDVIGQGGMAIVYRAKQIATGRLVAIKTLRSQNPPDILRFSQEIKTHSQLDHKNVVRFIDSVRERGQLFLVMERVRGISLEEILRTFGKLDEPDNIVDILSQILDALEYAHSGGLIHRDLKTGNVILIKEQDEALVVKILDFGIAKIQGDLQRLTHVGQALGSPIYMSPEQCTGKALTTKSDLYSLGVVAYETVTGTPPYSKGTLINVMAAHCNENIKPQPLSEMAPHLPKNKMLDQILQKALQTPAEKRWQSAVEFKTALQFWLKSIQNNAQYEELPVELMRCPVTEFDLDKLVASAAANTTPSKPAQPAFQWATEPPPEPASEPPFHAGQSQDPATAVAGENAGWTAESHETDDIWPEEQGGWSEGTKPLETVPGWGEQALATGGGWGGSEKHRQGGADETASGTSEELKATPESQYQAETSDLWKGKQDQVNQRRSPVRDLLASPATPVLMPPNNFDVQTSVEINAVGSQPPPYARETFGEITPSASVAPPPNIFAPEESTAGGDNAAVPEVVDLRRRQTPVQPPSANQTLLNYLIFGAVAVVFTAALCFYIFISNAEYITARYNELTHSNPQREKSKTEGFDSSRGPVRNSSVTPEVKQEQESKEKSQDQSEPDTKSIHRSKSDKTSEPNAESNSNSESKQSSDETSNGSNDSKSTDEASTTTAESTDKNKAESTTNSESTDAQKKDEANQTPSSEVTPFKKGEPEEGVDF